MILGFKFLLLTSGPVGVAEERAAGEEAFCEDVWIVTNHVHVIRPSGQLENSCSKSFHTILSAAASPAVSDEGMPVLFTGTMYSGCLFVWLLYFGQAK